MLKSFSVGEDTVSASLGTDLRLTLEANSLQLQVLSPEPATESLMDAGAVALDLIQPKRIRRMNLSLQHLEPVPVDYDGARAAGLHVLAESVRFPVLHDFAVLIDGTPRSFPGVFHVEFGVVSREEAPRRLARAAGRMRAHGPREDSGYWEERDLPEVAFFADSVWQQVIAPDAEGLDWMQFWEAAIEEASAVLDKLWEPALDYLQEDEHSSLPEGNDEGAPK